MNMLDDRVEELDTLWVVWRIESACMSLAFCAVESPTRRLLDPVNNVWSRLEDIAQFLGVECHYLQGYGVLCRRKRRHTEKRREDFGLLLLDAVDLSRPGRRI